MIGAMPAEKRTARQPRHWLQPPQTTVRGEALQDVVLIGSRHEADITAAISSAPLRAGKRGIASLTITVTDRDRELLGPLLDRDEDLLLDDNIDTEIAGIWWRLQGVTPNDQGWELRLEDRAGAWLRRHDKYLKAVRGRTRRTEFVRRLYGEAGGGIPLFVPELLDKQRVARSERPSATAKSFKTSESNSLKASRSGSGWPASETPTVKNVKASSSQLRAIVGILEECRRQGCSPRVTIAALMAATQESGMTLSAGTTGDDDTGLFQQGRPWISLASLRDPAKCCRAFLLGGREAKVGGTGDPPGWKQEHGSLRNAKGSLTEMISDVQEPAARYRGEYAKWEKEATRTYELWAKAGGGAGTAAPASTATTGKAKAYVFERGQDGKREDSVTCIQRLAEEVGWNHWIFGNTGVFASDEELIGAPRGLVIDRADEGVVGGPTWVWDTRKPATSMSVEVLVDQLPEPGQVTIVENEGPASGLWLIDTVDCDLAQPYDTARGGLALRATLGLARPQGKKPEPAPEYAAAVSDPDSRSSRSSGGSGELTRKGNKVFGGTVRDRIVFAAKEAARLDAAGQRLRRSGGDGYEQRGSYTVSQGITGEKTSGQRSDCSQFAAAMYWSAGAGDPSGQDYRAGYTGTLYANADRVSSPMPGDLVMYGAPPGAHVEIYVGNGKTIGHGDPAVDYSTPHGRSDFRGFYRPRVLAGKGR
jgi:hypothetical protein